MIPTMSCKDTKSTTLQLEKRVKGVSILLELGILEHPPFQLIQQSMSKSLTHANQYYSGSSRSRIGLLPLEQHHSLYTHLVCHILLDLQVINIRLKMTSESLLTSTIFSAHCDLYTDFRLV